MKDSLKERRPANVGKCRFKPCSFNFVYPLLKAITKKENIATQNQLNASILRHERAVSSVGRALDLNFSLHVCNNTNMNDNKYMNSYMKERYKQRRLEAIIKLGGKCVRCSSETSLHIHHKDPSQKKLHPDKGVVVL